MLENIIELEKLMVLSRNKGTPVYLQECRAVQSEDQEGEWEGWIRLLKDRIIGVKNLIKEKHNGVDKKLSGFDDKFNTIEVGQKGIEEKLRTIEGVMEDKLKRIEGLMEEKLNRVGGLLNGLDIKISKLLDK